MTDHPEPSDLDKTPDDAFQRTLDELVAGAEVRLCSAPS